VRCYIDQGLGPIVGNPEVIHWDMQIGTDKSACHQQWLGQQKRVFARDPVAAV